MLISPPQLYIARQITVDKYVDNYVHRLLITPIARLFQILSLLLLTGRKSCDMIMVSGNWNTHNGGNTMMDRITNRDLDRLVNFINKATGSPMTPYGPRETPTEHLTANIGNYHIDSAYGGVKLVRMDNDGGSISTVSTNGYGTKRELHSWMIAFLAGLGANSL